MAADTLDRNLKALQTFYPQTEGKPRRLEELKGLPLWMKGAVELYQLPLTVNTDRPLFLILPKTELEFEHLIRIYKELIETLHAHLLVVADPLPPKHRPLLVKFRIPFVYKDESVFAPDLGLKFSNLKTFQAETKLQLENKKDAITPFALKITSGLLTNQIDQKFTLKQLHEQITDKKIKVAIGKLSATLNDLTTNDLLNSEGSGPKKIYIQLPKKTIWEKIVRVKFAPFFREIETNHLPKDRKTYVIAGESALAKLSNLGESKRATIAMTTKEFRAIYQNPKKTLVPSDFGGPSVVQVWKETPDLFSIDGILNPIELYFSMRDNPDDRIQLALDELLADHGLERKE